MSTLSNVSTLSTPYPRATRPGTAQMVGSRDRRALREVWATYWGNIRTRRQLLELSDAQLRDVGLTRGQALREAWQPVWRKTA